MERRCSECGKVKGNFGFLGHSETICNDCIHQKRVATMRKNESAPRFIYALVDPRDSRIYYVGYSLDPERRKKDHYRGDSYAHADKGKFFKSLSKQGVDLIVIILEEVTIDNAADREMAWIRMLSFCGAPLINQRGVKARLHLKDLRTTN